MAPIDAPEGGATRENVLVWPASGSVAVAVNFSVVPFTTYLLPIVAKTGASLTAATDIFTHAGAEARQPKLAV